MDPLPPSLPLSLSLKRAQTITTTTTTTTMLLLMMMMTVAAMLPNTFTTTGTQCPVYAHASRASRTAPSLRPALAEDAASASGSVGRRRSSSRHLQRVGASALIIIIIIIIIIGSTIYND